MSINYPKGVALAKYQKSHSKTKIRLGHSPANRGMGFEADINASNAYYLEHDLCLVTKRPTPINVVKVDYTHGAKITQAYFETQSTTDYNGIYQGHYLDFEAKSTQSKTSFPLHNIPQQQIDHLKRVLRHGGIAFFIINCYALGKPISSRPKT
jgi:recombination protein U